MFCLWIYGAYNGKVSAQMKKLIIFSVLFIIVSGYIGYGIGTQQPSKSPIKTSSTGDRPLLDLVNEVRATHQVAPLRRDPGLDASAKIKAEDMAARNYWAHANPDGELPDLLIKQNRPGLKGLGENLVECHTSNATAMEAWVKSPGHLKNIVQTRFNLYGTYTIWDQDQSCLITVNHFGGE